METNFQDIFKNVSHGFLEQTPDQKQKEPKKSQEQKKEQQSQQPVSDDNINKLLDAFTKNPGSILVVALGVVGTAYCIYNLFASYKKLVDENNMLKNDFRSFRNETRSEIKDLKRDFTGRRTTKRVEDVFDVTDVEAYEIKTDEKPEVEKNPVPPSLLKNPFLA